MQVLSSERSLYRESARFTEQALAISHASIALAAVRGRSEACPACARVPGSPSSRIAAAWRAFPLPPREAPPTARPSFRPAPRRAAAPRAPPSPAPLHPPPPFPPPPL